MASEVLTAILVVITAIYAYLTYRMAKSSEASVEEIRAQSEAMLRPYISITPFVRPHALALYLKISNSGKTAAANLRLSIDRDFFQWGEAKSEERNLRKAQAFTLPIDSFSPNAELLFSLGQGWEIFGKSAKEEATPLQFSVTARYQFSGKEVSEVSRIDLRPYNGSEGARNPIVEELERIRKVLEIQK